MVGNHHELGESGVAEDGVVGQLHVGDVKVDELGAVVVAGAKGHRK